MEIPWQTYTKLQDSLNKVNLINANMQFILSDGNCVDGLLGDFVFDRDNLFLHLKDVSVNNDKLSEHTLMGMHISRWRIRELAPSIDNKASSSSIFSRATFCENGEKASKLSCNGSVSNKIAIDQSLLSGSTPLLTEKKEESKNGSDLSFRYQEIDLINDDDNINIDLSVLQLPASNKIQLIRRKLVYSSEDLQAYYMTCSAIADKLHGEPMVGFSILPQSDENLLNSYNNNINYVQQLNRPLFMQNVLSSMQYSYFCFSTAQMNYAFFFATLSEEDEQINGQVFTQYLKPLFESTQTQKIVVGCSLMSGILWHKYRIRLANVCDLQLIDRQIQKINIFHRKRPYSKYAPPPNVDELRTCVTMVAEYLDMTQAPIEAVTNWANCTTKVANVIRMSLIFLRELSARMNYELLHYMFAYSNRAVISLRSASEKEAKALTEGFTVDEFYQQLLNQPMFDAEKGIHFAVDLKKVFPLRYFDPDLFMGKSKADN